jgi:23S rRNA (uracil1939-C5)-methyltransferase
VASIALSENIAADARAAHLELTAGARVTSAALERAAADAGLTGLSARDSANGQFRVTGDAVVVDPLSSLTGGVPLAGELVRHAEAFFQGNRFLLASLVAAVIAAVPEDGEVLDLYAGVGLFAVSLAASGHLEVTAVEGDRASGADLRHNARAHEPRLVAHVARVEDYLAARRGRAGGTVVVDPPRTGVSAQALEALIDQRPARLVYVSCDPPTLARDARRLLDAGYALASLRAFDFFPNTPHIESLAVFTAP